MTEEKKVQEEQKEEKTQAEEQKEEQKEEEKTEETSKEKPENKSEETEAAKEPEQEEKKEEEKEIEIPEKFKNLVEEIEKMSVLDLAELVKILEKKFGVSAAAPVAVAGAGSAPAEGAESEEKTEFNIVLTGIGDKKIEVIKVVRDITEKGLKEAKDLVDKAVTEPQVVKEAVKKEEAEEIKKKFEAAGAKVELR